MTDAEIFPFMATMRDVVRVFPIRGGDDDIQQLGASYFKALRRYPLALVQAGAERVIGSAKHFPKPAEWLDAIPRASIVAALEPLSAFDADEWLQAERRRWEQAPCRCAECREAGMTDRMQRFVPTVDSSDQDARGLIGERVVTRGRWIHGHELARWYAAKEKFWAEFKASVTSKTMGVRVAREPGMEG